MMMFIEMIIKFNRNKRLLMIKEIFFDIYMCFLCFMKYEGLYLYKFKDCVEFIFFCLY